MNAKVPEEVLVAGKDEPDTHSWLSALRRTSRWLGVFAILSVVVGFLGGIFWYGAVDLPTYTIQNNFQGYTTERALTQIFVTDAWFSGLGLVVGAGIGYVAWRWFRGLGWPVTFIAGIGAFLAGWVCSLTGTWLGPKSFAVRLTAGSPGDVIPIDFKLHTPVGLLVWAFGGVLPVLVASSMGPDDEEQSGPKRPRRRGVEVGRDQPVEVGQVVGHDIAPLPEPKPRRRWFGLSSGNGSGRHSAG